MPQAIYLNLPVADLKRSIDFFARLGFAFDPKFSSEQVAAIVISETICAMLHLPESFRRFTTKDIADTARSTEVLLALQVERRERVDALTREALDAGGREARAAEDHGFMYGRAFEDPDGHIWEVFWMDARQVPAGHEHSVNRP